LWFDCEQFFFHQVTNHHYMNSSPPVSIIRNAWASLPLHP
jgi:hypothetical protein